MSDKNLMIFERRFEAWNATHPRRWAPSTNKEAVAEFISGQTKKIVSAQLKAADRIIVSQDRIASGIDKVGVAVDRVADGLEGLASAFEWGFSEMVWQLEQQRAVLEEILKVLQAPLGTQAKELKKRAEDAYRNGWIDDALKDFLESEKKNRYDFTIQQSLGNIYFFHKKIPEKALEYYVKAVKYATPKSPYHASIALIHEGLIMYLEEDFEGAYEAMTTAIELSPKLYEARYQCAQYCANLGKYDEAIAHLWEAIQGDRNYCLKAGSEKDFDVMREQLQSFFEDLRNKAQDQAKKEIDKAQELIHEAESAGLSIDGKFSQAAIKFRATKKKESVARALLKRASLFDCWDAIDEAYVVQKMALDSLANYFSDQIPRANGEYNQEKKKLEKMAKFLALSPTLIFIAAVIGAMTNGAIGACNGMALLIIGGSIFYWLRGSFSKLIHNFLIKKPCALESKLAKLQDNLSEVHTKRFELGIEEKTKDVADRDLYKEFLRELYKELPKELQEATYSEEVAHNIHEICTKNGVTNEDIIIEVTKHIGYAFIGVLPPNEFQKVLVEEVKLNKTVAKEIAQEINDSVFLPIKPSLEALYNRRITR